MLKMKYRQYNLKMRFLLLQSFPTWLKALPNLQQSAPHQQHICCFVETDSKNQMHRKVTFSSPL